MPFKMLVLVLMCDLQIAAGEQQVALALALAWWLPSECVVVFSLRSCERVLE